MRGFLSIVALACLMACASPVGAGPAHAQGLENGVNRPGGDYISFDLLAPNPAICQQACHNDARCRAFTYTVPGFQGPHARCWLKNVAPPPQPNGCCVSGVNSPAAPTGLEEDTDRRGADYRRIDMQTTDPFACRQFCQADAACVAFTFVKPGAAVPGSLCYLKNAIPPPTPSACCVSGVLRAAAPPPPPHPPTTGGGSVSGSWVLGANDPCNWTTKLNLVEAPDGSISGTSLYDNLNGSGGMVVEPSKISGSTLTLVIHPKNWASDFNLTGERDADGGFHGNVSHYGNNECTFVMYRQ